MRATKRSTTADLPIPAGPLTTTGTNCVDARAASAASSSNAASRATSPSPRRAAVRRGRSAPRRRTTSSRSSISTTSDGAPPSPRRARTSPGAARSRSRVAARSGSPAMALTSLASSASTTTTPVSTPTRTSSCSSARSRTASAAEHGPLDRALGRRVTRSTPTARRPTSPSTSAAALDEAGPGGAAGRRGDAPARPPGRRGRRPRRASSTDDDGHPSPLALAGARRRRRRRRHARGAGCDPRARAAPGPGSRPSSSPSRRRSARYVCRASAWRPTRYCAVISWPAKPSCSGLASTACSQLGEHVVRAPAHHPLEQLLLGGQPPRVELDGGRAAGRAHSRRSSKASPRHRPRAPRRMRGGPVVVAVAAIAWTSGLEGVGVDGTQRRVEAVAAGLAADGVGLLAERPPQPRHVHLDRLARSGLRTVGPQPVDQLVERRRCRPRRAASRPSTRRCLGPPRATGTPSDVSSSGPRTPSCTAFDRTVPASDADVTR